MLARRSHSNFLGLHESRSLLSTGLELDPANEQLRAGLEDAKAAKDRPQSGGGPPGMGGLFGPDFLGKLALNPQTRHLMQQPDFLAMLQDLGRNPNNMSKCVTIIYRCP